MKVFDKKLGIKGSVRAINSYWYDDKRKLVYVETTDHILELSAIDIQRISETVNVKKGWVMTRIEERTQL